MYQCLWAYRLAEQKAKAGSVDLHVGERGSKQVLRQGALKKIVRTIEGQLDITLAEIVEKVIDSGNGMSLQKEDDSRFRTVVSLMRRQRENNEVDLQQNTGKPSDIFE